MSHDYSDYKPHYESQPYLPKPPLQAGLGVTPPPSPHCAGLRAKMERACTPAPSSAARQALTARCRAKAFIWEQGGIREVGSHLFELVTDHDHLEVGLAALGHVVHVRLVDHL